jgi:DNA-binding response OmpR family regulator
MRATNKYRRPVVLVVEDEVWILLDVAGALEEQGYLVLCARNGDEALSLFEDRNDIGILFTDIAMPGSLNGLDLAREVRRRRPDVGVLLTSGRDREMDGIIAGCDIFIPKPYEPRIVISRIGSLIDSDVGRGKSAVSATPCYVC